MTKKLWWASVVGMVLIALGIRLFHVTQSPPSPYWEEVALGYDAYSIALTGADHHGHFWPTVAFESFGDWKPSGYFYALAPFVKLLGLNVFAVRLPSALAGVGIVTGIGALMWLLSASVTVKKAVRAQLVFVSLFLAAISPWLIQLSRSGWEANLATFLVVWGVVFGWWAVETAQGNKRRFVKLILSVLLLVAAMYTYHSARVLAPALGLIIGWQFLGRDLKGRRKNVWLAGYLGLVLMLVVVLRPFVLAWGTPMLTQRLAEAGALQDISQIERSNILRALHGNSLLSRVIYHRYVLMAGHIASQFFSHFRLDFLFITGDSNPRHTSQYFGLFYPFEIIFLFVGAYAALTKLFHRQKMVLFVWLVFGILPAALTKDVPHALRILPVAPVFILTVTFGVWCSAQWLQTLFVKQLPWWKKLRWMWLPVIVIMYGFFFTAYFRYMLTVYPQRFAAQWQDGYEPMVRAVEKLQAEHPDMPVFITREQGRPAMYFWFYTATDPRLVQQAEATAKKDQGEFLEFENIQFVNSLSEVTVRPAIVVGSPENVGALIGSDHHLDQEQTVVNLADDAVWRLGVTPRSF